MTRASDIEAAALHRAGPLYRCTECPDENCVHDPVDVRVGEGDVWCNGCWEEEHDEPFCDLPTVESLLSQPPGPRTEALEAVRACLVTAGLADPPPRLYKNWEDSEKALCNAIVNALSRLDAAKPKPAEDALVREGNESDVPFTILSRDIGSTIGARVNDAVESLHGRIKLKRGDVGRRFVLRDNEPARIAKESDDVRGPDLQNRDNGRGVEVCSGG